MINLDFVGDIEKVHNCQQLEANKDSFSIVYIFKAFNSNSWVLLLALERDYLGDDRSQKVFYCPFCGQKLDQN
jgi:hypothetical protein